MAKDAPQPIGIERLSNMAEAFFLLVKKFLLLEMQKIWHFVNESDEKFFQLQVHEDFFLNIG